MKISFLFLFMATNLVSVAQTKLISHKSHSGSHSNFNRALKENLFNIGNSNFGNAPEIFVRNSKLDTVKLLSPQVAVMVTSESCHYESYHGRPGSSNQLWSAGSDTVYDHPLFNEKNTVEEVKRGLKNDYYFANNVDDVVFIGFDGNYATVRTKKLENSEVDNREKYAYRKNGTRRSYFMIILISLLSTVFHTPF
ncbi:MAG: hypothetical protein ACK46O_08115 [Flavobacteriia bacterium]|jgi:hypothetical protein